MTNHIPDHHNTLYNHWIAGREHPPQSGEYLPTLNPIDDSVISEFASGNSDDVDAAVSAAHETFQTYSRSLPQDRERWLCRAADLMEERVNDFVDLLINEIGSPISKARREIETSVRILRAAAGAVRHCTGKSFPSDVPGRISLGTREPLGVVAGITPFNVPLIKNVKHSAMALATGNTVVLSPSEEAPGVASLLATVYEQAGIPAGAFNIVTGDGEAVGRPLVQDHRVRFVGFTGSTRVGDHISATCGQLRKRYSLEMGGKNALVILDDASLQLAVQCAVAGGFLYQGQICMASSRVIIRKELFDDFMAAFVQATQSLSTSANLWDSATMLAPIITERQRQRIRDHLTDASNKGAEIVTGGDWDKNVCQPTIVLKCTPEMQCFSEETFGPVVCVFPVDSDDEALEIANAKGCGLSASVLTSNMDRAMRFARELRAGMVHVNAMTIQEEPHVPFGGVGESGFGREGTQVSIDDLTEWKWVTLNPSGQ